MRTLLITLFILMINSHYCLAQTDTTVIQTDTTMVVNDTTTIETDTTSLAIDTTRVPFIAYWSKGDSYNFRITKIKNQWKAGKVAKQDSSAYITNFLVTDSTDTSYTIKWSYETNLSSFNIPEALADAFSKYELTEVIYRTTETGEFLEIENWEEISKTMLDMCNDMIKIMTKEEEMDEAKLRKIMEPMMQVYSSKEGIEQLVFKELYYFHFPFGASFSTVKPINYKELLPNMFGGDPIKGDVVIHFEEVNFEDASCVFVQNMKLDPKDTKAMLNDVFKRMGIADKDMANILKTAQYDIIDRNEYGYFFYPGVPYKIETNREVLMDFGKDKARNVEIIRIELVE